MRSASRLGLGEGKKKERFPLGKKKGGGAVPWTRVNNSSPRILCGDVASNKHVYANYPPPPLPHAHLLHRIIVVCVS